MFNAYYRKRTSVLQVIVLFVLQVIEKIRRSKKPKIKVSKEKTILLRVSNNLKDAIDRAIDLGIADNASEFVRRCVVNQLLDLNLLGLESKEQRKK